LRGVSFGWADLLDFVAGAWPLIAEAPDVTYWAREFVDAGWVLA
jgi:hypothetical protein